MISVIIPTIGRPSLRDTLASLHLRPGDEAIVVGDGPCPEAADICHSVPAGPGVRFRYFGTTYRENAWGCWPRTVAIQAAVGTHLAFLDDDDIWMPGARAIIGDPSALWMSLFRLRYPNGGELWRDTRVRIGNVSTQMIVVPNDPKRLGRWTERREGDYDFICGWTGAIEWRPEVIAYMGHNDA